MTSPGNIVSLFFDKAKKYPTKAAIIHKTRSVTFSEFENQIVRTSTYLINKGIGKGDRVMLFVPMSIDLYRIVLAIFNIGATAVFLDEWVSKKRMEECCKIAQCKGFIGIFKARVFAFFSSELRKIPIKLAIGYPSGIHKLDSGIITDWSDTALITFTTGSTGTPKAAKRTHGFLLEQFKGLLEKIDPQPEDIDMPVLPIVLLINLGAGCTSIISEFKASKPDSMDVKKIVHQLNTYKVTRLVSSPFFVKQLAKYVTKEKISLHLLKKIFTGGAPVFPIEAELYDKAFPDARVEIIYGSTEAEPISSINVKDLIKEKEELLKKGLKVGAIYRKAEVKIVEIKDGIISCENENELNKLVLPSGKIGEIIVSGPHVLKEYFNNESALRQNKIFIGEKCWHRTGDSGYIENEALYLTGRCNTLINVQGKIIAPFIYENYFQSIAGVEMGTIMNINNVIYIILEVKSDSIKKDVIEQVQKIDVKYDHIKLISRIPRDPRHHSKIDYVLLTQIMQKKAKNEPNYLH